MTNLVPLMTDSKSKAYWMNLADNEDALDLADRRENGEYVYKD